MDKNNNKDLDISIVTDQDKHLKLQLCLEYRTVIKNDKKKTPLQKSQKSSVKQLDATVLWLKNVPKQSNNNNPTPFVKISLMPDNIIYTTELQEGRVEAKFFETFNFTSVDSLAGKFLHVQVCNKKVTRNALAFGQVKIPLDDLELEKPMIKWYDL